MFQDRQVLYARYLHFLIEEKCFSFQFCWILFRIHELVIDQQNLFRPFWLQSSFPAITPLSVLLNSPPLTICCNLCWRRLMISASLKVNQGIIQLKMEGLIKQKERLVATCYLGEKNQTLNDLMNLEEAGENEGLHPILHKLSPRFHLYNKRCPRLDSRKPVRSWPESYQQTTFRWS